ncbi:MAG: hypothetical protein M1835_008214 [Candelina submexicana]|nr:MAG: hypothetical protein M1835_008214 [Candelina submexicana]
MAPALYILEDLVTNSESKIQQYSSLIGIVTAIVGNILISFALNIQRYAHIRLGREQEEENRNWNRGKGKHDSYGTQRRVEDGKSRINKAVDGDRYDIDEDPNNDANEAAPLMQVRYSRSSSDSDSTYNASSNAEKQPHDAARKPYLKSSYWWAGILLMTVGEAGNFLAYGFAPASIVSPLGVVALVSNCVIAPFMLKERFRLRDFGGVVVAVAGAVVVVLSANSSERKLGQSEIWDAITRWEFEVYLGVTVAAIIALMLASGKYGEKSILIDLGLVGLFGGYTALSTKGIASLLSYTFWHVVTFPITYLLLAILIFTAFMQIRYVNRALQRFDSTVVIPTQFVLFTISVIIGSAVLYRDFKQATAGQVGEFVGGCALTFLGVYLITSGRAGPNDDGDGEDDHDDGVVGLLDNEENYRSKAENGNTMESQRDSRASSVKQGVSELKRPSLPTLDGAVPSLGKSKSPASFTPEYPSRSMSSNLVVGESSVLHENPWSPSGENLSPSATQQHPGLQATASSPLLPSEAQETSPDRPSTPRTQSHAQPESPTVDRPATLSRKSMSRIMPGPLISPLSSPLSAVVADSLRRGNHNSVSRRRIGGSLRTRGGGGNINPRQAPRHSVAAGDTLDGSPLKNTASTGDTGLGDNAGEGVSAMKGRARSFSASIGEFLRGKGSRRASRTDPDDER